MMVKDVDEGDMHTKEQVSPADHGRNENKKAYHCSWCGFTAVEYQQFLLHVESHSTGKFICSYCHQCFNLKAELDSHIYLTHIPLTDGNHGIKHENNKPRMPKKLSTMLKYECSACSRRFSDFNAFKSHMEKHDVNSSKVSCKKCGKWFKSHMDLYQHCSTGQCMVYSCHWCSKVFMHRLYLQQHIAGKHEGNQYICPTCNKRFNWRSSLRNHRRECSATFQHQ